MFSDFKYHAPLSNDLTTWLKEGAVVVDVRTPEEFVTGHVKGSVNIPLDEIPDQVAQLKTFAKIIVCCRSGGRSGSAMQYLNREGFTNIVNGGSWQNVDRSAKEA
ncbi:MAG: rhodanese-like domain-containing protein [Sediminibacterium sp.]|nr:rhodanese-like domain-containing protein [Sediminibacterium sp.]